VRNLFNLGVGAWASLLAIVFAHVALETVSIGLIYKILSNTDQSSTYLTGLGHFQFGFEGLSLVLISAKCLSTFVTQPLVAAYPIILGHGIRDRFLSRYISGAVEKSLSSQEYISNFILVELPRYTSLYLGPRIRLFSEFITASASLLIVTLIIQDRWLLIYALLMVTPVIFLTLVTKQLTRDFGNVSLKFNERLSYLLSISIMGRPEITARRLTGVVESLSLHANRSLRNQAVKVEVLSGFVRPVSELGIFALLLLYISVPERTHLSGFADIAVVALAGLKIIPLLSAFADFLVKRNYVDSVESKYSELAITPFEGKPPTPQMIHIDDSIRSIVFTGILRARGKVYRLTRFEINRGEPTLIYGESGAGKSTILEELFVTCSDFRGDIVLNDKNRGSVEFYRIDGPYQIESVSLAVQAPFLLSGNVFENIAFSIDQSQEIDLERVRVLAHTFNLNVEPARRLDGRAHNVSGGQLSRLNICRALYRRAEVYIFDEPTTGLDNLGSQEVLAQLIDTVGEKFCIIVTHDTNLWGYLKNRFQLQVEENGNCRLSYIEGHTG
jgi:ABC-type transport system involved in cytochrome bd biosynthesis fused ATPase/permease subunit